MKRKRVLISIVALTTILLVSSMVALTQAWWPWSRPEYVTYNLRQIRASSPIANIDNSSFPIIIADSSDVMIAGNLTIGDHVYTYPNDFTYNSTLHVERNAITGDGIVTGHKIFVFFNLSGKPTLESWLVTRISGYIFDPNTGQPVNPANMHSSGEFKLTGTGMLSSVDGFGLEQDDHHFGFIKGWPMK
jgi:hypothetical protein